MAAISPEDCDVLIFEYLSNKDLKSVLTLFETDAVFVHPGGVAHGHAAIGDAIKGWLDAESLQWLDGPHAFVDASGTLAFLRGTWSAVFKNDDGTLNTITGKNIEVVRKQSDGTWKFIIDHATGAE